MFTNTISNKWTEAAKEIEATIELIVFSLGDVIFGIHMAKIDRIVNKTNLERLAVCDSNQDFNLNAGIEILDLHHQLFGISIINPTAIVIFKGDRLAGIPIDTTPTITTVPLDIIRILPDRFRTNSPLAIASHIAVISDFAIDSAIFIIGN
jgi:hypothetical protein